MESCRFCGSTDLLTVLCTPPLPHYARTNCRACGRFLNWVPAPMTFDRAARFVMPFGKYQGQVLDHVAETDDGLRYLDWLRGQDWLKPTLKRALDCYLGSDSIAVALDRLLESRP